MGSRIKKGSQWVRYKFAVGKGLYQILNSEKVNQNLKSVLIENLPKFNVASTSLQLALNSITWEVATSANPSGQDVP